MSGILLFFTLCGNPQYIVISTPTEVLDGTAAYIAKHVPLKKFKEMLQNEKYGKREIKLDRMTGMICA